jgi:hypothetical protein
LGTFFSLSQGKVPALAGKIIKYLSPSNQLEP